MEAVFIFSNGIRFSIQGFCVLLFTAHEIAACTLHGVWQ
jgi:hypothetical protein